MDHPGRDVAIANNIALYVAVTGAHGVKGVLHDDYWSTDDEVPWYYSNLVTRTENEAAQVERIRELCKRGGGWTLKDSFASLDLEPLGLEVLFESCWYGAPAGVGAEPALEVVAVETRADLVRWEDAWQVTSPLPDGTRMFPPELLDELTFLAVIDDGKLAGGAIANLSDGGAGAVGISNVFGVVLRECAQAIQRRWPDRAVVGYGPRADLNVLEPQGFSEIGPLKVWVRRPGS